MLARERWQTLRILGKNTIFNEHPVFAKEIIFQKAINCGKAFCTSAKKQSVHPKM